MKMTAKIIIIAGPNGAGMTLPDSNSVGKVSHSGDLKQLSKSDPRLTGVDDALRRAARRARKVAEQTGTDLILSKNGELVRISPLQQKTP